MLQKDVYKFPHMPINPDVPCLFLLCLFIQTDIKTTILHLLIKVIQPMPPTVFL